MKKWIAVAALLLFASAVRATTFPNTYAVSVTASYDPNTGSQGTLYLSYQYTGATQQSPMCNSGAHHTPQVGVQMFNNGAPKSYHYSAGYGVAPCIQMNQTLTLAFDLGGDGCTLDFLSSGECVVEDQTNQIYCSVAGTFVFLIQKYQFEYATTETQTVNPIPPYPQVPYCAAPSDPPDWSGPKTSATDPTGFFVASNIMWRSTLIGTSFTGILWHTLFPVGLATAVPAGPKPICTQKDKGCVWDAVSCTGS